MVKRHKARPGSALVSWADFKKEIGWEEPETFTQWCCGLVHPYASWDHIRTEICSENMCEIWFCQCGAEEGSNGPVGCRHDPENRYYRIPLGGIGRGPRWRGRSRRGASLRQGHPRGARRR